MFEQLTTLIIYDYYSLLHSRSLSDTRDALYTNGWKLYCEHGQILHILACQPQIIPNSGLSLLVQVLIPDIYCFWHFASCIPSKAVFPFDWYILQIYFCTAFTIHLRHWNSSLSWIFHLDIVAGLHKCCFQVPVCHNITVNLDTASLTTNKPTYLLPPCCTFSPHLVCHNVSIPPLLLPYMLSRFCPSKSGKTTSKTCTSSPCICLCIMQHNISFQKWISGPPSHTYKNSLDMHRM